MAQLSIVRTKNSAFRSSNERSRLLALEQRGEGWPQRNRPLRTCLGAVVGVVVCLPAHDRAPNVDGPSDPRDITPSKPEHLAPAQARELGVKGLL